MPLGLELCQILTGVSDLKTASIDLLNLVKRTFSPASCTIIIHDPYTNKQVIRARTGRMEKKVHFYDEKNEKKAFVIRDGAAVAREKEKNGNGQKGVTFAMPLISKKGSVGILNIIDPKTDSFGDDTEQPLSFYSESIANTIETIMAREALEQEYGRIKQALKEKELLVEAVNDRLEKAEDALKAKETSISDMAKQLVEVKQFSESVLQSISSGIILVDREGRISYMNKGAEKILHSTFEGLSGKPLAEVFTLKEKGLAFSSTDRMSEDHALGREKTLINRNGVEIPIGFSVSSHLDPKGREIGKIIHFRDLTEINKMQEEILRMDRLISLGEISMGIAHEIRNPLAGIRITAQAIEEELDPEDPRREYLIRIISEIDRLNDLLKSFFSFAKPENPNLSFCHIQDIIQEVYFFIQKDLRDRGIDFIQDYEEGIPRLRVDFNQIKQVFLNLFLNSIHAMPRGGVLRIGCTFNEDHRKTDKGSRCVEITVSDTGKGIDENHILRIFNPFFTTKAKGLGLGLSITYRIIKRHHGTIKVQSEEKAGTVFTISLPIEYEGNDFV